VSLRTVPPGVVQEDRRPVERHHATQRPGMAWKSASRVRLEISALLISSSVRYRSVSRGRAPWISLRHDRDPGYSTRHRPVRRFPDSVRLWPQGPRERDEEVAQRDLQGRFTRLGAHHARPRLSTRTESFTGIVGRWRFSRLPPRVSRQSLIPPTGPGRVPIRNTTGLPARLTFRRPVSRVNTRATSANADLSARAIRERRRSRRTGDRHGGTHGDRSSRRSDARHHRDPDRPREIYRRYPGGSALAAYLVLKTIAGRRRSTRARQCLVMAVSPLPASPSPARAG